MPLEILSVSALVCDKYLIEKDDVFSLVRVIDVFFVPPGMPEDSRIEVQVVGFVKTRGEGKVQTQVKLIDPSGSEKSVSAQEMQPQGKFSDDPLIPGGFTLAITLHLKPTPLGTYSLRILLDGKEEASVYFTLRAAPDIKS